MTPQQLIELPYYGDAGKWLEKNGMKSEMARDTTLQEVFETVLYHYGVDDSGKLAKVLYDEYLDWIENVFPLRAVELLDSQETMFTFEIKDNK